MCDNVLVSIIIPAYNVEQYIINALDSIFVNQNIKYNFEVIVIDDGSTDNTLWLVKKYRKKNNLYLIAQNNQGQASARNNGIHKANGKFILFLDSDDFYIDYTLNDLFSFLSKTDADVIEFDYKEHDNSPQLKEYSINSQTIQWGLGQNAFVSLIKNSCYRPLVWSKAFSRKLLINNELYFHPGICFEDEEWCPRVYAYAKNVQYYSEYLYVYRTVRLGSVMSAMKPKYCNDMITVIDKLEIFSLNNLFLPQYISALRHNLSMLYMAAVSMIKYNRQYDESNINKLDQRAYILKYSNVIHRKYLYFICIKIFGVKQFYILKFNRNNRL